ncbi:virion morphogenesis protein [Deinococcus cellulosilyticus NBRC 106333 = KACC 11606]|uniref:Virion morphogenesis protein n=1 Tax=Deinococcus cellulosilyticus (strain DSM 18568 / NBRC 106333 / KACC 11606 / 5516J-15) TaxID=1223518 RepID=A0A511MXH0_DEIC1|nr:virion morphogenesis protein [Deinococcus cellulosilyticus NBRC 106333 = KACC 11606]
MPIQGLDHLQRELRRLSTGQLEKPSKVIAEGMVTSTKKRFGDQVDPDGKPWKPLSPVTIKARLGGSKAYTKKGQLRKAAARRVAKMKILIVSAQLMNSIQWRVRGGEIAWGTNVKYARLHNFGSGPEHKSNVPARPFMGINQADQVLIEKTVTRFLEGTL